MLSQAIHNSWSSGTSVKRAEGLFTGNQNSESTPEPPVRRRPHRPVPYAGQYGQYGGTEEAKMNCELLTYNPLLLGEQQTSYNIRPPATIDILIHQYSNNHKYKYVHVYVYMHVCTYRLVFSSQMLYITVWCSSKVKPCMSTFFKLSNSQTNVRVRVFHAGLLAWSQLSSRRSCDRPTRSRFSVVSTVLEQMLRWYPNSK
jgi:hypothetical protein